MRLFPLVFLFCASCVWAQTMEDPEVARARLELARLQGLVETGVLPPVQLEKAKAAVADAEDGAVMHRDIQQQDLTEEEADQLVAAAGRRFERRKQAFDDAKKLIEAGAAPQLSLGTSLRDLDFARKEYDLAETRARLAREIDEMARAEEALQARMQVAPADAASLAERFDGNGVFNPQIFHRVEAAFEGRFGHPLPVSANGETAVHRALGFDHRGRVDVALRPDQPEGVWLRQFLTANGIPFFAFRQAVPGKATGAHIHLGPMSTRLAE
ncbi:MAG: hypothetical protein P4L56_13920 [Candidatus Sulfopaludibacter sp.]|nr:hypothetical protein [Candidatus Sulfopaludibacter sp.]